MSQYGHAKKLLSLGVLGLALIFGFQNCAPMQFGQSTRHEAPSSIPIEDNDVTEENIETPPEVIDPPPVEPPIVVDPPIIPPIVVDPPPVTPKIFCNVSSSPATKPTGFAWSSSADACVPTSGNGPTYEFTLICDSDLPSDPAGIRIQYYVNYNTPITNSRFSLTDATTHYRGRSFYKPSYAPSSNTSIVYQLTDISKVDSKTVRARADFFFIDGHPADATTQDCNNVKSWDLNVYVYIDKGLGPELFNETSNKLNLQ